MALLLGMGELSGQVSLSSPRGQIRFRDSREHFEERVLPFLRLSLDDFEQWLALAEDETAEDTLEKLGRALRRMQTASRTPTLQSQSVEDGPFGSPGSLWHMMVSNSSQHGLARVHEGDLAWLVEPHREQWRRVKAPARRAVAPAWDQPLLSDARHRVRELRRLLGSLEGRVLEVAPSQLSVVELLAEHGLVPDSFNADDPSIVLEGLLERKASYDAALLLDVCWTLPDPVEVVKRAASLVAPEGVIVVRGPNPVCPEARLLGQVYPAFRRENLVLLGPRALADVGARAGLLPIRITSTSHLLTGFIGRTAVTELSAQNRGTELVGWFRKPA